MTSVTLSATPKGNGYQATVTYSDGVAISSAEAFPTQAEAISAAALRLLDMPRAPGAVRHPGGCVEGRRKGLLNLPMARRKGSRAKRKEEALNGLPPAERHQNSSVSLVGTVSTTRSSIVLGSAP